MYQPTPDHIDMWRRGWSCTAISDVAGVSKDTVCRAMTRLGFDLQSRPKPAVDAAIVEIKRLRAEGHSTRDIADIVGWSARQVSRWIKQ